MSQHKNTAFSSALAVLAVHLLVTLGCGQDKHTVVGTKTAAHTHLTPLQHNAHTCCCLKLWSQPPNMSLILVDFCHGQEQRTLISPPSSSPSTLPLLSPSLHSSLPLSPRPTHPLLLHPLSAPSPLPPIPLNSDCKMRLVLSECCFHGSRSWGTAWDDECHGPDRAISSMARVSETRNAW